MDVENYNFQKEEKESDPQILLYLPLQDFCIDMPKEDLRAGRNMQQTCKGTILIKIYLCCVRLVMCSLCLPQFYTLF